jgi:prevent-host-death family protein
MSTVTAREANQHFSKILDAAARGEEVTITRRGKPVAKLVPVEVQEEPAEAARRAAEREAILKRLERGYVGTRFDSWTRDELYDERFERSGKPDDCA